MLDTTDYDTAADGFAAALAGCEGGDLSGASPCPDWKAQDVIEHVLGGAAMFAQMLGGEAPEVDGTPSERFAALRAAVVAAANIPGVEDRTVPFPPGSEMPTENFLGIAASDTLIHTWDLAKATGQQVTLDPGVLERSWERMKPADEFIRQPGIFGPKIEVGDDAPADVQALAFFGRDAR